MKMTCEMEKIQSKASSKKCLYSCSQMTKTKRDSWNSDAKWVLRIVGLETVAVLAVA